MSFDNFKTLMRMYIVCSVGGIKPFLERPGFSSGLLENEYDTPYLRQMRTKLILAL